MHSNWTICIPLKPFCPGNFQTFLLSYWEANSYYPIETIMGKRNSSNPKIGWQRGVSVPGAFKLDHLHPIKPLLSWKFSNFLLSYWEANSYYPRGLICNGKGTPVRGCDATWQVANSRHPRAMHDASLARSLPQSESSVAKCSPDRIIHRGAKGGDA